MSEPREKEIRIAIKYNNLGANGTCPICGQETDPRIPLELFLNDNYADVCEQCGEKYAPELHELLAIFYHLNGDMMEPELKTFKAFRKFLETMKDLGIERAFGFHEEKENVGDLPF